MGEKETQDNIEQMVADARKTCPEEVVALLQIIASRQTEVLSRVDSNERKFETHLLEERERIDRILSDAFPNGDPNGHRKAHEIMIQSETERAKFYSDLRNELFRRGIFWILALVVGLMAFGISGWLRAFLTKL